MRMMCCFLVVLAVSVCVVPAVNVESGILLGAASHVSDFDIFVVVLLLMFVFLMCVWIIALVENIEHSSNHLFQVINVRLSMHPLRAAEEIHVTAHVMCGL